MRKNGRTTGRHRAPRIAVATGLAVVLVTSLFSGVAHAQPDSSTDPPVGESLAALQDEAAAITLTGASATSTSGDVTINGGAVTITAPGAYEVSGTLNDGYLQVDSPGDGIVYLILNGVNISSSTTAPVQVAEADEVVLVLADGSSNQLSDAANYVFPDPDTDEPNAALFSKDDLTIQGGGSLRVQGNYNDGIASKDDLIITGGTIVVDAVDDGIRGKDLLQIDGGDITVTAADDGLKSDDEDPGAGIVSITNGTVQVDAGDDAITSVNEVNISGGTVTITDSYEGIESMQITISGGVVDVYARDDAINAVEDGIDEFAVAPNAFVRVTGGTVLANSDIDTIDSNGIVEFLGGTVVMNGPPSGSPGEGAIDSNGPVYFNGGTVFGAGSTAMAVLSLPPTNGQGWVAPALNSNQSAGTVVHLVSNGQVLVSYRAPKNFRELLFSSAAINNGQSYQVFTGGSLNGQTLGGMSTTGGSLAGATQVMTVTAGQYSGGLIGWPFPPPPGPQPPPPPPPPPPPGPQPPPPPPPGPQPPPPPPPGPQPPPPPPPGGGCTATYSVTNEWPGGFQGEVQVTAGSSAISGWTVSWTFSDGQTINQAWSAVVSGSPQVTATNEAWNGNLGAGASTSFGFIGSYNGSNSTPTLTCTAS